MKHTIEMRINPAHNTNAVYHPFQQYNSIIKKLNNKMNFK